MIKGLGVKQYDRVLIKLNDLFLMNEQVRELFSKMHDDLVDSTLKSFFKEKELERNEFCNKLQNESKKLEAKVDNSIMLNRRNHLIKMNFKNLLRYDKNIDLFLQVANIMEFNIEKYNELLMEMNLSLTLCKLLMKQRDDIQSSLYFIKREVDAIRVV